MAGAPRIFEKVFAKVTAGAHAEGGAKKAIFNRAMATGRKVSRLRLQGKEPSGLLATEYKFADKLVYGKLRDRFGGRIRYFISGSAALSQDIGEWFHAAGITILEGYGLTETSAGTFINRPATLQFGTVGPPFAGTAVKLDTDGEVLVKGPGVMQGYHNLPDDTAECFTADGWFRTGDIGEFTGDGLLRITDRKKDLIKTSGGKFVAPQSIEAMFKATCPYASNMVVHGEGRKFVSALVTLDPEAITTWAEQVPELSGKSYEQIVASRRRPRDGAGVRRPGERPPRALGDDQEVRDPAVRPHGGGRRPHAVAEDQAQGRRGQEPRRPGRLLQGVTPPDAAPGTCSRCAGCTRWCRSRATWGSRPSTSGRSRGPYGCTDSVCAATSRCRGGTTAGPTRRCTPTRRSRRPGGPTQLDREVVPGLFGENLRTEGVDVDGAVVGERWQVGEAGTGPLLEVTMPRTPCATFTHRMREPDWHRRFSAAGRPGAYLRVLRTGSLRAGDRVQVVHRPAHGVTVAAVSLGDRSGTAGLREAVARGEVDLAEAMRPYLAPARDEPPPSEAMEVLGPPGGRDPPSSDDGARVRGSGAGRTRRSG